LHTNPGIEGQYEVEWDVIRNRGVGGVCIH
jgi:hypothetical protein